MVVYPAIQAKTIVDGNGLPQKGSSCRAYKLQHRSNKIIKEMADVCDTKTQVYNDFSSKTSIAFLVVFAELVRKKIRVVNKFHHIRIFYFLSFTREGTLLANIKALIKEIMIKNSALTIVQISNYLVIAFSHFYNQVIVLTVS